jgi:hypothetical protein
MISIDEPKRQNIASTILRWLLFLPAAIVGGYMGSFVAHWVAYLFWSIDPSRIEIIMEATFEGGAFGFIFVYVGIKTAPKFSTPLAIILGVLGAVICGATSLLAIHGGEWLPAVSTAAGAVTSIVTCISAVSSRGL